MIQKRNKVIIIALVYILINISILGILYLIILESISPEHVIIAPIKDVDEERRFDRPHTYINSISSSNISSVENLYLPRFFDNDNITVHFPEGDRYGYRICLGPDHPSGSLIIYHSNGSELDREVWQSGEGSLGASLGGGGFEGGENLILNFSGSGIVIFLPESTTYMFADSPDHSGTVECGIVAFYLPWELIMSVPEDRRIVAEMSSNDRNYFHVRYYDEEMHLLAEAKGTKSVKTQIPSGDSPLVIAVVESEGNISFKFTYSSPILGELIPFGMLVIGSLLMTLACAIFFVISNIQGFGFRKS